MKFIRVLIAALALLGTQAISLNQLAGLPEGELLPSGSTSGSEEIS